MFLLNSNHSLQRHMGWTAANKWHGPYLVPLWWLIPWSASSFIDFSMYCFSTSCHCFGGGSSPPFICYSYDTVKCLIFFEYLFILQSFDVAAFLSSFFFLSFILPGTTSVVFSGLVSVRCLCPADGFYNMVFDTSIISMQVCHSQQLTIWITFRFSGLIKNFLFQMVWYFSLFIFGGQHSQACMLVD